MMSSEKVVTDFDQLSKAEISALIDKEFSSNRAEQLRQKALDLELQAEAQLEAAITTQQLELAKAQIASLKIAASSNIETLSSTNAKESRAVSYIPISPEIRESIDRIQNQVQQYAMQLYTSLQEFKKQQGFTYQGSITESGKVTEVYILKEGNNTK